jgi:4'-phosphopantetheinyl transferase
MNRASLRPASGTGEVGLWWQDVEAVPAELAWATLDDDEKARASRYQHAQDARRFVAGRWLLRTSLAAHLPAGAGGLRFAVGAVGSLRLRPPHDATAVRFSLSHAGRWALVAISGGPVGVDVERIRPLGNCDEVAATCFAPEERARLHAAGEDPWPHFYRMWTRKEAWCKAAGTGLGAPVPATSPDLPAGWSGAEVAAPQGYAAAVVVAGGRIAVRVVRPAADAVPAPGATTE